MSKEDIKELVERLVYDYANAHDNILSSEEVSEQIHALYLPLLEQAKQEGIKEVVEWIRSHPEEAPKTSYNNWQLWRKQVEVWFVDEPEYLKNW